MVKAEEGETLAWGRPGCNMAERNVEVADGVVGAFANFTDIYITLSGFLEGLRAIDPKPTYPIVIRRDGPHREEAFAMLEAARAEGFDFHLFDSTTSMNESAQTLVKLVYPTS